MAILGGGNVKSFIIKVNIRTRAISLLQFCKLFNKDENSQQAGSYPTILRP